jgi:hypothetical protein
MLFEYRVTKYDPAFRDASGAYIRDEWTSVSDIGRSFGAAVLTCDAYQRVEDAYVAVALAFLREAGVSGLTIAGLENHSELPLSFGEGSLLLPEQTGEVIRQVLREKFWCRLDGRGAFIHLGYDYYMYVGVRRACPEAEQLAKELGLFAEPFPSPYQPND